MLFGFSPAHFMLDRSAKSDYAEFSLRCFMKCMMQLSLSKDYTLPG